MNESPVQLFPDARICGFVDEAARPTVAAVHGKRCCAHHGSIPIVLGRRLYFDELVGRAADRAAKEEKRRARAAEAFRDMLRATKGVDVDTTWDEASVLLASDRDYQAVSLWLVRSTKDLMLFLKMKHLNLVGKFVPQVHKNLVSFWGFCSTFNIITSRC